MIMLLKKQEAGNSIEAVYDSSNIFKSIYFPNRKILYLFFHRGGVYSYGNVSRELYEEFETAVSQGEFFADRLKYETKRFPYRKEFKLKQFEIKDLTDEIGKLLLEREDFLDNE